MPPQQFQRLLDLDGVGLCFCTHNRRCSSRQILSGLLAGLKAGGKPVNMPGDGIIP